MIVGVLSDSHGDARTTASAVALLEHLGAAALVHCGDIGGDDVLSELLGLPARFVWGNTDYESARLRRYAESIGLTPPNTVPVRWTLAGKNIAIYHGHERQFETWLRRGEDEESERGDEPAVDYVLYGHTHVAADARIGGVRLINPGALHRARIYTVATLDLVTDQLDHWIVPHAGAPAGEPQRFV